jgi:hypothetical protein
MTEQQTAYFRGVHDAQAPIAERLGCNVAGIAIVEALDRLVADRLSLQTELARLRSALYTCPCGASVIEDAP